MRSRYAPALAGGILWLSLVGSAAARAPARPHPSPRVVMVAAKTRAAASKELYQAVRGQLIDAKVALELHWVQRFAASPPAQLALARKLAKGKRIVAVFWCDVSAKGERFLYLAEPGKGRLIVRSVASAGGGGLAESVAIIVSSSVRAILRNGHRSARKQPRVRPRRGAAVRSGRARRRSGRRGRRSITADHPLFADGHQMERRELVKRPLLLALEMGYVLDFYGRTSLYTAAASATDHPPQHGASIGLSARFSKHWSAYLTFRAIEPVKVKGEAVQTSLQRYPVTVGGRVRFRLGRLFELGGGVGFTLDYIAEDTKTPSDVDFDDKPRRPQYLLGAELRFAVYLVDRLRVGIAVGAEVALNPVLYNYDGGGVYQSITIDPWWVRPYFRLSLCLDII